eukprot:2441623-Prorocentrum_lima.AAC.1
MEPWGQARGLRQRSGVPSEAQGPAHHNAVGSQMPARRCPRLCFLWVPLILSLIHISEPTRLDVI